MSWIKYLFANIAITFFLLGILLLAPPIIFSTYSLITYGFQGTSQFDDRSHLELYDGIEWAEQHFIEMSESHTNYYDYITWKKKDFAGETINIVDGIRKTMYSNTQDTADSKYYFFGGSTTWGSGVDDANTFPSKFAKLTNSEVLNFGEPGYIARQSLAYLNNYLINHSPLDLSDTHVVFYDGVNEVIDRCRSEIHGLATGREDQIQKILSSNQHLYSFRTTFAQLEALLGAAIQRFGAAEKTNDSFNCASNSDRAREVASTLVDTWELAAGLVENRGGQFTAILQPVVYIGNPDVNYLDLDSDYDRALSAQYQAVYPIILELAAERDFNILDLTDVYDECKDCYIDFCHVGPQAHEILVSELISRLSV